MNQKSSFSHRLLPFSHRLLLPLDSTQLCTTQLQSLSYIHQLNLHKSSWSLAPQIQCSIACCLASKFSLGKEGSENARPALGLIAIIDPHRYGFKCLRPDDTAGGPHRVGGSCQEFPLSGSSGERIHCNLPLVMPIVAGQAELTLSPHS